MDEADEELPPGGVEVGEDPPWDAWQPLEVTERLAGVDVQWCVAAGWALDLFRGERTREHEDLEIAVPIGRFDPIRKRSTGSSSTSSARAIGGRWTAPRST